MAEVAKTLITTTACPVQVDGELADGRPFYFRYRYAVATLAVGPECDGVTRDQIRQMTIEEMVIQRVAREVIKMTGGKR